MALSLPGSVLNQIVNMLASGFSAQKPRARGEGEGDYVTDYLNSRDMTWTALVQGCFRSLSNVLQCHFNDSACMLGFSAPPKNASRDGAFGSMAGFTACASALKLGAARSQFPRYKINEFKFGGRQVVFTAHTAPHMSMAKAMSWRAMLFYWGAHHIASAGFDLPLWFWIKTSSNYSPLRITSSNSNRSSSYICIDRLDRITRFKQTDPPLNFTVSSKCDLHISQDLSTTTDLS